MSVPKLSKRIILPIVSLSLVVLLLVMGMVTPIILEHQQTATLKRIYTEQARIFTPTVERLTGISSMGTTNECIDQTHTYTRTESYCVSFQRFKYNGTLTPASSRPQVMDAAKELDELLAENGWKPDRPQDSVKSVVGSVPAAPLAAFHVMGVPFYKNIGSVSCNIEISFEGPTQGSSPGAINVNQFSCQQHISYFMLHIRTFRNHNVG